MVAGWSPVGHVDPQAEARVVHHQAVVEHGRQHVEGAVYLSALGGGDGWDMVTDTVRFRLTLSVSVMIRCHVGYLHVLHSTLVFVSLFLNAKLHRLGSGFRRPIRYL